MQLSEEKVLNSINFAFIKKAALYYYVLKKKKKSVNLLSIIYMTTNLEQTAIAKLEMIKY